MSTVVTAAALVVMVATNWEEFSGSAAAVTVDAAPVHQTTAAAEPVEEREQLAPPARETPARSETVPAQPAPKAEATLVITAARGPSWLEVRAGDSTGEQLYFGTLEEAASTEFERLPVWVALGAAESVDVWLGGSSVQSLPIGENGIVQFVASAEGVTAASQG